MQEAHGESEHVTIEDCAVYTAHAQQGDTVPDNVFIGKLSECEVCKKIYEEYMDGGVEEYFHKYFNKVHPRILGHRGGDHDRGASES